MRQAEAYRTLGSESRLGIQCFSFPDPAALRRTAVSGDLLFRQVVNHAANKLNALQIVVDPNVLVWSMRI